MMIMLATMIILTVVRKRRPDGVVDGVEDVDEVNDR